MPGQPGRATNTPASVAPPGTGVSGAETAINGRFVPRNNTAVTVSWPNPVGTPAMANRPSASVRPLMPSAPAVTVAPATATPLVSRTTPVTVVNVSSGDTASITTAAAPSFTAVTDTTPRARPMTPPSGVTVAMFGLLTR